MSVVYFIRAGVDGPIKIGTAKNVTSRLKGIAGACPDRLSIIATIPGGRTLEQRIHRALHRSRRHFEWFNPTQEVRGLAIVAARLGLEAVERWLDRMEARITFPGVEFDLTGDKRRDIKWLISLAVKTAISRHGIDAVSEAMGRSADAIEYYRLGRRECTIVSLLGLALLDAGACAPIFAYSGGLPEWMARQASEEAITELLGKLGPKGVRA